MSYTVTVVGMESTGVYWRPVYALLEAEFECWLLNAQDLRNVPGRKTDVADAAWIAQLVAHGLVRASFVPPKAIRELRELTRYRKSVIQERSREAQRLHKTLEGAGIKLSSVASDILGVSGRAMLQALIDGTHDPDILAELARGRLRKKLPPLRKAVLGRFSPTHRILVGQLLAHFEYLDESIERLSDDIATMIIPFAQAIDLLDTIPGVDRRSAEVLLAEIGPDMSQFSSPAHLGRDVSGQQRVRRQALLEEDPQRFQVAAHGVGRVGERCYSNEGHLPGRKIRADQGSPRTQQGITAVAQSILMIAYHMQQRSQPYNELGGDYFLERQRKGAYQRRLVKQLERMGYDVALSPKAA